MPILRPFRALRYQPARVPDLSAVLCPPYDVIGPQEQAELLRRHPFNAVRLELPPAMEDRGDGGGGSPKSHDGGSSVSDDDARYREAARTLVAWRSEGVLAKDASPSLYVHEMRYETGSEGGSRTARGFMARLRLEPLEPGSGVRPHERTMSGPKEDRYRLLRATGTNLSPVVLLHERSGTDAALAELTAGPPDATATESSGVGHRLWAMDGAAAPAVRLLDLVGAGPLTIADGHHRYETALRYREERGQRRACESDRAYDYVLVLVYAVEAAPAAMATHRVVQGLAPTAGFLAAAAELFSVERLGGPDELLGRMATPPPAEESTGRFGYRGSDGCALLVARRERLAPLLDPALPEAARWLDTSLLAAALGRLGGIGSEELSHGGRVTYLKDAAAAISSAGKSGGTAFLLDPTPVSAVLRVADAGGVMPQKSTYFQPKAPTGLLFNALE